MKQLPLPFDFQEIINWSKLDRDEQHFLCYLIVENGSMIPPPYPKLAQTIKRLKAVGLVREPLLGPGWIEITEFGERICEEWFEFERQTGRIRW